MFRTTEFCLREMESQIGVKFADSFVVESSCLDALQDIDTALDRDGQQTFRGKLAAQATVQNCLVPLVVHIDDEDNELMDDRDDVFDLTVKLMARLSQSYDTLVISGNSKTEGVNMIEQMINNLVCQIYDQFTDTDIIEVIQHRVMDIIEKNKMTEKEGQFINDVLYLYRNLLYASCTHHCKKQTVFIGLLLNSQLKETILYCVNSAQKELWVLSLIQLITLLLKDTEKGTKSSLLRIIDLEEEEEMSSPNEELHRSESFGCNDETVVSESHDCSLDTVITPDIIDTMMIAQQLQSFAKELLENGWPELLYTVKTVLVTRNRFNLSSQYYSWNVNSILTLASIHGLPFQRVKALLSQYIIDYLVFIAVQATEQLESVLQVGDLKKTTPCNVTDIVKQLIDAVGAISSIFNSIEYYWSSDHLTPEERQQLLHTKCMLTQSRELRLLSVFLHRHYCPQLLPLNYLKLIVKINHSFLTMSQQLKEVLPTVEFFDMREHVSSFANKDTISTYSHLLTHHHDCSLTTLESAFTMLYHIAFDVGKINLLLQVPILNALSEIDDGPMADKLSKAASEFIEDIFECFLDQGINNTDKLVQNLSDGLFYSVSRSDDKDEMMESLTSKNCDWKQCDLEELAEIAVELEGSMTYVDDVMTALHERGIEYSVDEVINQLKEFHLANESDKQSGDDVSDMDGSRDLCNSPSKDKDFSIQRLTELVKSEGHQSSLSWVQTTMLDMVYIHLGGTNLGHPYPEEPVIMHYIASRKSVPLVAYTQEQLLALNDSYFSLLLDKLNIQQPSFTEKLIFPRIPKQWTVKDLIDKASLLGEINFDKQKFTEKNLRCYLEKSEGSWHEFQEVQQHSRERKISHNSMLSDGSDDLWLFYIKGKKNKTIDRVSDVPWWQKTK